LACVGPWITGAATAALAAAGATIFAVAVADTSTVGPAPSTCIIATRMRWLSLAVKVTPAIEWLATATTSEWLEGSPKLQVADVVP